MSDAVPSNLRPFRVGIEASVLDDVRRRVREAALPDVIGDGWKHGTDAAYLRAFRDHWVDHYDWPRAEARLNAHPQFTATVDGLEVHFYWERATRKAAPAILFTHGWPGPFSSLCTSLTDWPTRTASAVMPRTVLTWSCLRCPASGSRASRALQSARARRRACGGT
jgi:Epoxide hydrolase N terminus